MLTTPVWLSPKDPTFSLNLAKYLGDKAPKRMAALGNLEILHSKPLALICSIKCPGNVILKTYDLAQALREAGVPVIGGFHSPMERECLRILLRGTQPIIVCPARSLRGMRVSKECKDPLDQGRLLFLSPFPHKQRRPTVESAVDRNYVVAALADRVLVPYAAPSSKTFELCRVLLSWRKPLYTLANEPRAPLIALGAQPLDGPGAVSRFVEK